jgi:hypothetical protein
MPSITESPVSTTPQPGRTATATKGYIPREPDEIEIRPRDEISIEEVYEDGWCKGRNGRTGETGELPGAWFE